MMADPKKHKPVIDQFQFGPWSLSSVKSHILESEGPDRQQFESQLELPNVPEMIFSKNVLRLEHSAGFGIEFNALDALKLVDAHHDLMKVAIAKEWQEARSDCEFIKEVIKPFDWTFTSDYKGTLLGNKINVSPTEDRIDMEKLKVREKIHFYSDILLFEDELSDNGTSIINVKIRVMPTSFFILMRQYVRVDGVLVRINDTRVYHEAEWNYILREYTSKEKKIEDLKVPIHVITDSNEIAQNLDVKTEIFEKLGFPSTETTSSDNVAQSS